MGKDEPNMLIKFDEKGKTVGLLLCSSQEESGIVGELLYLAVASVYFKGVINLMK